MRSRVDEGGYGEGDRLPWLETVEDDYPERTPGNRLFVIAAVVLALLVAAAGGYYWYSQQRNVNGNGELIEAPAGDYKVKPEQPGGMQVEGEGDTLFATSQGAAANASINVAALPEAPVEGKVVARPTPAASGAKRATVAIPPAGTKLVARPATPVAPPAAPASPPAGSGSVIQLGAFPSEGAANIAWVRLSKRFSYLAPLGKSVERAQVEDKWVWRLRVNAGSNGQARDLCGRLKVAGEGCFIAN